MKISKANLADSPKLAEMNYKLIRDEGHRNPMNKVQLTRRMKNWLRGEYRPAFSKNMERSSAIASTAKKRVLFTSVNFLLIGFSENRVWVAKLSNLFLRGFGRNLLFFVWTFWWVIKRALDFGETWVLRTTV